jgi:hypothetical protein
MFYPYPDWESNPDRYVYLGSEVNPHTGFKYDYWVVKTGEISEKLGWSCTARHGTEGPDYGSNPLCICWYDTNHFDKTKDYHYGMERCRQLGLYYLATGEKPLLKEENQSTAHRSIAIKGGN